MSRHTALAYTLRPFTTRFSHLRIVVFALVIASLTACSFSMPTLPRVHRITIQQGNVMSQEMIDKLKPGMTRRQVAFVMGEPVIRNTFNDNRWDYIFTVLIPNFGYEATRMSLFFENDKLSYFSGDMAPTIATDIATDSATDSATESATESATDSIDTPPDTAAIKDEAPAVSS